MNTGSVSKRGVTYILSSGVSLVVNSRKGRGAVRKKRPVHGGDSSPVNHFPPRIEVLFPISMVVCAQLGNGCVWQKPNLFNRMIIMPLKCTVLFPLLRTSGS